jgi:hypothetical protein
MKLYCGPACLACKEADEITLDYGVQQNVYYGTEAEESIRVRIVLTDRQMREHLFVEPEYAAVKDICKNNQYVDGALRSLSLSIQGFY